MKHCEEYSELISAFIDNEISDAEAEELKAHLAGCRDCQLYLLYLEKIHTESATLAMDVPDGFSARVMNAIAVSEKSQKRFAFSQFKFTAIAAAIILLVFAAGRLESFFPQFAEDSSDAEISEQSITNENRALVPATLSPMYTEEHSTTDTNSISVEKANTASDDSAPSLSNNKKESLPPVEKTPEDNLKMVEPSSEVPAPEVSENTAVEDSSESGGSALAPTTEAAPAESDSSAITEASPSEDTEAPVTESEPVLDTEDSSEEPATEEIAENTSPESDVPSETTQEEQKPSIPPMPAVPQSESFAFYITVNSGEALALFSGYTSTIYEGNYLISIDKANLSNTLSLLDSSSFSYYRYDGDGISPNFLLIIIP